MSIVLLHYSDNFLFSTLKVKTLKEEAYYFSESICPFRTNSKLLYSCKDGRQSFEALNEMVKYRNRNVSIRIFCCILACTPYLKSSRNIETRFRSSNSFFLSLLVLKIDNHSHISTSIFVVSSLNFTDIILIKVDHIKANYWLLPLIVLSF